VCPTDERGLKYWRAMARPRVNFYFYRNVAVPGDVSPKMRLDFTSCGDLDLLGIWNPLYYLNFSDFLRYDSDSSR
jgi:hypothetical protein